ncbi:MAG: AAA family ATPase [Propionivibrio sp.]|uniref:AAA family ATPase n=1 Tax=Propionivibrio sp. TaxID=2212460 RepID=UPI001B5085AD|nr:AAA family ATPase [Propionivibrio sp.]MBP7202428.1 AAA family ATPase [Propionivibrio sp.]
MYLEHFGLREAPFRITPHTEFFFAGANRGATLEALIYAITHDEGIVKVSGEVGSGKTMLCRMLLEKLPPDVETVYLANPSLSAADIHHAIADELQTELPDGRAHQRLRVLQDRLLEIYAADRKVVVMIDEAHAMPSESLEEIRLLSNLESNKHKLLHIVLFGQPELDERLAASNMRQLKERITHNFALEPLRRDDIGEYLMFRMRAAGYRGPDLFTPDAVQLVSKTSEGLTRRINILADKALLSAFSENKHQIDRRQVKAAARDAQLSPMRDGSARPVAWVAGAALIVILTSLAFVAGSYRTNTDASEITTANTANPLPAAPEDKPVAPPTPDDNRQQEAPAPIQEASAAPAANAEHAQADQGTPPVPEPAIARKQTLAERIAATNEWLERTPETHYFIQLLSTDGNNEHGVEIFLENVSKTLDPKQIRVYRSTLSGRERLGVIYGDFATRELASAELAKLAPTSAGSSPYLRTVSKLR